MVQCGSFPSRWKKGEFIKIEIGREEGPKTEIETALTYEPVDAFGEIVLTETKAVPVTWSLSQNHPNPFNLKTNITYSVSVAGKIRLTIYDLLGRRVKTLVDYHQTPGQKSFDWDGTDDKGNVVASGIYFYRIEAGAFTDSKKMVILK